MANKEDLIDFNSVTVNSDTSPDECNSGHENIPHVLTSIRQNSEMTEQSRVSPVDMSQQNYPNPDVPDVLMGEARRVAEVLLSVTSGMLESDVEVSNARALSPLLRPAAAEDEEETTPSESQTSTEREAVLGRVFRQTLLDDLNTTEFDHSPVFRHMFQLQERRQRLESGNTSDSYPAESVAPLSEAESNVETASDRPGVCQSGLGLCRCSSNTRHAHSIDSGDESRTNEASTSYARGPIRRAPRYLSLFEHVLRSEIASQAGTDTDATQSVVDSISEQFGLSRALNRAPLAQAEGTEDSEGEHFDLGSRRPLSPLLFGRRERTSIQEQEEDFPPPPHMEASDETQPDVIEITPPEVIFPEYLMQPSPRGAHHNRHSHHSVPSSFPVSGESFCDCPKNSRDMVCSCGEDRDDLEWCWDKDSSSYAIELSDDERTAFFHVHYSSGTAATRGTQPFTDKQYFWEIKMTSPVYGTDMMVGIATETVQLDAHRNSFVSLLGKDADSWGLSYYGRIQNRGAFSQMKTGKFGQGTIIGVHVDMWYGTLTFFKNRRCIGQVRHGLNGKVVYPVVTSTAARTSMKVITSCSFPTSLQYLCCQTLRKYIPCDQHVVSSVQPMPPGLRAFLHNNLGWLLRPSNLPAQAGGSRKRRRAGAGEDEGEADRKKSHTSSL